jgi:hypothetical protein
MYFVHWQQWCGNILQLRFILSYCWRQILVNHDNSTHKRSTYIHMSKCNALACYMSSAHLAASRSNFTSSPGLNAGIPINGPTIINIIRFEKEGSFVHPSQRKASPSPQLPQLLLFPWTVKSSSSEVSVTAGNLLENSLSAFSCSLRPHVQFLHALRRFPARGTHSAG